MLRYQRLLAGTYLRECAVVPNVAVVGEAVAHEPETVLLDILHSEPQGGLTLVFVETKRMADMLSEYLMTK